MISLVVETENTAPGNVIQLEDALRALRAQTVPIEQCDVIFLVRRSESELILRLRRELPSARIEVIDGEVGYGQMKMYGARLSRHPIVAFTDTDCRPEPDWLEQVLANFKQVGNDVMILQGRTTFIDRPGADFCTFYLFGGPWIYEGDFTWMVLNNFAARKEAFERYPFADLSLRKGVEYLMIKKLLAEGKKIRIVPSMRVTHNYQWGMAAWFNRGRSDAYDFVTSLLKVKSLVEPPALIRWRAKLYRLCLQYSHWVFSSLKAALKGRHRLELRQARLTTCLVSALTLWCGGMVGFVSWKLGLDRPESPF